jgi:hypothetical protein
MDEFGSTISDEDVAVPEQMRSLLKLTVPPEKRRC